MRTSLKRMRILRGMTQVQVGKHLGLKICGYSDLERGYAKGAFTVDRVIKLSKLFGCNVEDIIDYRNNEKDLSSEITYVTKVNGYLRKELKEVRGKLEKTAIHVNRINKIVQKEEICK